MDATAKIIDIQTLKVLKQLTFRPTPEENNYIFRGLDLKSNILSTLQSPMRGDSYITLWDKNFNPIRSKKVSSSSCISMKRVGWNFVLGESSGNVLHIDSQTLDINYEGKFHELATRSIANCGKGYFFTSSPDQMIASHKIKESSMISFKKIVFLLFLSIIVYMLKIRSNQLLH